MSLTTEKRLQSFFYELLRDHLPCAIVEEILQRDELYEGLDVVYSNPYLAGYALDIAKRLCGEGKSEIQNRLAHGEQETHPQVTPHLK